MLIVTFGIVGVLGLQLSRAATPVTSIELGATPVTAPGINISDATASGGTAVKFGTPVPNACTTKPDASNTGTTGTLTPDSRTSLNTAGETIENKVFSSDLVINAANVTLRNVRVAEGILINERNNILLDRVAAMKGIGVSSSSNVTIQHSYINSFDDDAVHITSDGSSYIRNFTIKHSFIDRPSFTPGTEAHWDGIQIRGADTVNIYCNNIDAGAWQYPYNVLIYPEPANGGNNNLFIDNNWLNGGNFAIMAGMPNTPMRFEITNNKLRGADFNFGLCFLGGGFTPATLNQVTQTGNTLDGNPITRVCNESDL